MWLSDLFEKIVFEKAGLHVSPMIENPGRVALTNSCLYFQPLNNIYAEPVLRVKLSDLRLVEKRRYLLTHVGIELFTKKGKHEGFCLCLYYSLFLLRHEYLPCSGE